MNPFLEDSALNPLWRAVQVGLERNGLEWRGDLTLPELSPEGRRRLGILTEFRVPATRRKISLAVVAAGTERLSGMPLVATLEALGHGPAGRREAAAARREATERRRAALDEAATLYFGDQNWVNSWRTSAWTDGLFAHHSPADVGAVLAAMARVLACTGSRRSRGEVAALLFGDAHALDAATRLTTHITRALVARDGPASDDRAVWERAGIPLDLVSAPVLTWGLPVLGDGPVQRAVRAMTTAGLPMHLSIVALRTAPLTVTPGARVLVVENPRLVEAAAERQVDAALLCANGSPTTAPALAMTQLRASGAGLRYHGDFDATGLALTARALAFGCEPYRMSAEHYVKAVAEAANAGVDLPRDPDPAPATPWDPALAPLFDASRAVIHEERVMDDVLASHAAG